MARDALPVPGFYFIQHEQEGQDILAARVYICDAAPTGDHRKPHHYVVASYSWCGEPLLFNYTDRKIVWLGRIPIPPIV